MSVKTENDFLPSLLVKMTEQQSDSAPVAAALLEDFKKISALEPPANFFCRGILYHKLALLEEIMQDYLKNQKIPQEELAYDPVFAAAADGKTLREQAEDSYRKALKIDPNFNEAHFNLAVLLKDKGDESSALGHFKQSANGKPHTNAFPYAYLAPNSFFETAEIFCKKEKNDLAELNYKNALQGLCNFGPYHSRIAHFFREQGRLDEAMEHFDRIMPYSHRYVTSFVIPDFNKIEQETQNQPSKTPDSSPCPTPDKQKRKNSLFVGAFKFLRRKTIEVFSLFPIIAAIIVITFILILGVNFLAEKYLQKNPELLLSKEEKLNQYARKAIDSLMPVDKALLWYELEKPEQIKEMWDEWYQSYVEYEPYTQFRAKPVMGKYYKVTEQGYRMTRDPGPWPPSTENYNIFFFGGSTAFHEGPSWASTASHLQDVMNASGRLKKKVYVYNFGRTSYASTQERILFQQLLLDGYIPNMAVFLDGLNDFAFPDGKPSGWQNLANLYDEYHRNFSALMRGNGIRTRWNELSSFLQKTPLYLLAQGIGKKLHPDRLPKYNQPPSHNTEEKTSDPKILQAVIDRYLQNMRQIKAVSAEYGVISIFVWQPIPTYKYDLQYHAFRPDKWFNWAEMTVGYPLMEEYIRYHPQDSHFIWMADMQENLKENLYVDSFHYTSQMAQKIAVFISQEMQNRSLIK